MRAGRVKALFAALLLIVSVVPFLALSTGGASAAPTTPARSAQSDIAGFPVWYQDANGVRVTPCIDPNDANCAAAANPTYNPALPLAFPGNYPNEFFYSAVASQAVIVADCPSAGVAHPGVVVNLALEGAFLNGTLTPGDQMVFGRIRVVAKAGSGLCANTWYTFATPYGPATIKTDANGAVSGAVASANTYDQGCLPGPSTPCNYDAPLAAPVLGVGLLHQVTNAAPGYLGSGAGFDAVTGGAGGFNQVDILRWPADVTPPATGLGAACTDPGCTLSGTTNHFSVAAKLAGPLQPSVPTLDFGGQPQTVTSADRTVSLTNLGSGPLGLDSTIIDSITVAGVNAADFFVHTTSCPVTGTPLAAPMPRDGACDVNVNFTPSTSGPESAALVVSLNGGAQTFTMPLAGSGLLAGQLPAITVDPADGNLALGPVRLTTSSAVKTVTVTNSGTAPLQVLPTLNGADAAAFTITNNDCTASYLAVGASCSIGVKFTPSQVRLYSALLDIANNSATGTFVVALTGDGTGGVAAVGPVNPVNTQPDWYQDEHGVRLGQCDDPSNPLCITAFPSGTATFPTNYPSEWFYYLAQSTPIDVQDPACGITAKQMFVTAAVESAFLGTVAPNAGTTFGRLRIVSHGGLCPNTQYLITHPYGQTVLSTDSLGNIKPHAGTTDVGCVGAPCDFTIALAAPQFESFLEQTAHPAGYLGNPLAPSGAIGSPYTDPLTGQPANLFRVQTISGGVGATTIGGTDQFTVSGRLVGPMVASPAAQDFGAAEVGLATAAVTKTITFTNTGIAAVTLATPAVTVEGPQAADYSVTGATCADNGTLAPGASCTVDVRFAPSATGARNASLVLHHNGKNNPLAASLTGVGNSAAGTAAISANLTTVKYTDLHIGAKSASVDLVISNLGGSSSLQVGTPTITAGQPFTITGNSCTGTVDAPIFVQPNVGSCTISVNFVPTVVGTFAATLAIPSNAASGTLSITLGGKAVSANPAQSAATTVAGFPMWFQDGNGVRVEPCLSQADQNCVLLPNTGFDPAQPIVWPTNYPLEAFYTLADSELITIAPQACVGGTTSAGGTAMVRLATEGTFAGVSTATPGAQAWFNRVRVTASGLCPSTTYTFVHPFGTLSLTTDGAGDIKPKAGTFDNANVTTSSPLTPGILQWDPNVSAPPAGYLGDARSYHKVVGSQFSLTPGGDPEVVHRLTTSGAAPVTIAQTDKFLVAGRIAGPVVSNPTSKDFGSQTVGTTSATQTFTITNISTSPIGSFTAASSNTTNFVITSNNCPTGAATLAADTSCQVRMQFKANAGDAAGVRNATLSVGYNGLRSPLVVALTGNVLASGTSGLTLTPTTLTFGNVNVGATSAGQTVLVKNSGSAAVKIQPVFGGANPTQYTISSSTCAGVNLAVNGTCSLTVAFKPTSTGSKPASLAVNALNTVTNAVLSTSTVTMTGTGAQGTIQLSTSTLNFSGPAGRTSTAKLTLTNTGNAPFTLQGAPFYSFVAISANNPVPKFSASQTGCNAVAPGKNCTVTVSMAVPAGTATGTLYAVTMRITSDASNSPTSLTVNGTVK